MTTIASILDVFLHLDTVLGNLTLQYGSLIYLILFGVFFAETGLVVTPFLPGDSLLLTAGVLAGGSHLDFAYVWAVCTAGAILGDASNYWIGRLAGKRIIESGRFVKRDYVERTSGFFERHGGKTVTIARFFPIVRTFAPFMAGVGGMHFPRFLRFSVIGTLAWITLFAGAGYLFGQIAVVRDNLEWGVMFVLSLSLIPAVYHWQQRRKEARAEELAGKTPVDAAQ